MGDRTTLENLRNRAETINKYFKNRRVGVQIEIGQRYGKKAIDLYDLKGGMLDTVRSGMTSGECYEFMLAMIKTMDIIGRYKSHKKK